MCDKIFERFWDISILIFLSFPLHPILGSFFKSAGLQWIDTTNTETKTDTDTDTNTDTDTVTDTDTLYWYGYGYYRHWYQYQKHTMCLHYDLCRTSFIY